MKFAEKCACGASMAVPMPPNAGGEWGDWAMAQLKDWRVNHRHEFAPEPAEPEGEPAPHIHESGSYHERAPQYMSTENDIPVGFTRNEVR